MPAESLRFLHAADLHLEQPPHGLAEVPDHLRDLLIDAPFQAAARVFENAIVEDVDFVVLSGDVLNPRTAGPHALSFLFEQFQLLREQKIHVYWAGGRGRRAGALAGRSAAAGHGAPVPQGRTQGIHAPAPRGARGHDPGHERRRRASTSARGDFRTEPTNRFTVAVAHGEADAEGLASHKQIDYWARAACTSRRRCTRPRRSSSTPAVRKAAVRAKTGRTAARWSRWITGRKARTKFIPTDVLRWREETLPAEEATNRNDLQRHLRTRMQRIAAEAGHVHDAGLVADRGRRAGGRRRCAAAIWAGNCWTGCGPNSAAPSRRCGRPRWNWMRRRPWPRNCTRKTRSWATSCGPCGSTNRTRAGRCIGLRFLPDLSRASRRLAALLQPADRDQRHACCTTVPRWDCNCWGARTRRAAATDAVRWRDSPDEGLRADLRWRVGLGTSHGPRRQRTTAS